MKNASKGQVAPIAGLIDEIINRLSLAMLIPIFLTYLAILYFGIKKIINQNDKEKVFTIAGNKIKVLNAFILLFLVPIIGLFMFSHSEGVGVIDRLAMFIRALTSNPCYFFLSSNAFYLLVIFTSGFLSLLVLSIIFFIAKFVFGKVMRKK